MQNNSIDTENDQETFNNALSQHDLNLRKTTAILKYK